MNTRVINLVGSCGVGKSTTAAGLFHLMKLAKINVELTTEWIKGGVWEERFNLFNDQLYITAKQNRQLHRLIDKVDFVISDSPLFLGGIYVPSEYYPSYNKLLMELFNEYNNINYYLNRVKPYCQIGRSQTELESNEVGDRIVKFMSENNIEYKVLDGDEKAAQFIFNDLFNKKVCRLCDRELDLEHDVLQSEGICNFCSIS